MKTTKRLLTALLAALLILTLAAYNNGDTGVNVPTSQSVSNDFQKNMHQSTTSDVSEIAETNDGIYVQFDAYVYYIDKATKEITILCGKPECKHNDSTCSARLYAEVLWAAGDKLYFTNRNLILENGSYVNYGLRVYSVDPNGTNRRVIQKLQFTPGGDTSDWAPHPIQHRGIVYFPYSGILYAMPLGGDIEKDAVAIWGEEVADSGMYLNTSAPAYTLWADGDTMYFMVTLTQADKTRKETLFAYNTTDKNVKQVWQAPDADEVGSGPQRASPSASGTSWTDIFIFIFPAAISGGVIWKAERPKNWPIPTSRHCQLQLENAGFRRNGMSFFAGQYTSVYSLNHHITCRLEARQALIYQLVLGLTGENDKYNYSKAVHDYPPFFDIICSAKNYKIAPALTLVFQLKRLVAAPIVST